MPVGLRTPIVPATTSSGIQLVSAKTIAGDDHQERAGDQDTPATQPVGVRRQPQRDHGVADQGQGQDDADRDGVEPDGRQVQDQDDRQEPVAEHPEDPRREQQTAVAVEATEAGDQPGLAVGPVIPRAPYPAPAGGPCR